MNATAQRLAAETASTHRVVAFFTELGDAIAQRVGPEKATVSAQLTDVAIEMLTRFNPSQAIGLDDLIDYVMRADSLCKQADLDGKFAEPPVSLYRAPHFDISALIWLDGTTSVHQHAFCGAFHVLEGGSIHSQFAFTPWSEPESNARAIPGRLALQKLETLRRGDTRPIHRGSAMIHSLFHMYRPSVTIVVRTITDDLDSGIQYDYRWPGMAHDPFQRHAPSIRKQQYLRMLHALDEARFEQELEALLVNADLYLAYSTIHEWSLKRAEPTCAERWVALCQRLPPAERDLIARACRHDIMGRTLVAYRRALHEPAHRFLLALLLNVFDRQALLDLVAQEFPGMDPVLRVGTWLSEVSGNTEHYPNLLGVDLNPTALAMLEQMLRGHDAAATLHALAQRYDAADVAAARPALLELYDALRTCALFHAIFADLPAA